MNRFRQKITGAVVLTLAAKAGEKIENRNLKNNPVGMGPGAKLDVFALGENF